MWQLQGDLKRLSFMRTGRNQTSQSIRNATHFTPVLVQVSRNAQTSKALLNSAEEDEIDKQGVVTLRERPELAMFVAESPIQAFDLFSMRDERQRQRGNQCKSRFRYSLPMVVSK